jgi:hypothetical protein
MDICVLDFLRVSLTTLVSLIWKMELMVSTLKEKSRQCKQPQPGADTGLSGQPPLNDSDVFESLSPTPG